MQQRTFTIAQRVGSGFLVLIALLTAVAAFSWRGLSRALADFDEYRHCARSSVIAGRIQSNFLYLRIAANDFAATRASKDLEEYRTRKEKISQFLADARAEFHESSRLQTIATIEKQVAEHFDGFEKLTRVSADGTNPTSTAEVDAQLDEIGEAVAHSTEDLKLSIIAQQDEVGPRAHASIQKAVAQVLVTGAISAILAVLIAVGVVVALNRILKGIATSIDDGADLVASAASQVAAASQTLAQGACEQAASLEETSSSMEEIAGMTARNTEGARKAKDLSNESRQAAETGAAAVAELSQAMDAIKASAAEMSQIIKTIDEIAFQTNILALNAAVEAARAGEAGAGFAVVADEVRSLAQRSAHSAKETSSRIEDSLQKCDNGVRITGRVKQSLGEILESTRNVDTLVGEITVASQEQSQGLSQVSTAVVQMDKVTQANASGAEEAAASAEQLTSQARIQKDNVARLMALVEGKRARAASFAPSADSQAKSRSSARATSGRGVAYAAQTAPSLQ